MKTIPLTRGEFAIVDDCDFDRLSQYNWQAIFTTYRGQKYTMYAQRHRGIYMHRQILEADKGQHVDHINHNGLDNRRCNLRIVTRSGNGFNRRGLPRNNTSGFLGVTWSRSSGKWQAGIQINQRSVHLGLFDDKKDAAEAYIKARSKL